MIERLIINPSDIRSISETGIYTLNYKGIKEQEEVISGPLDDMLLPMRHAAVKAIRYFVHSSRCWLA